jgi:hypothetical protein
MRGRLWQVWHGIKFRSRPPRGPRRARKQRTGKWILREYVAKLVISRKYLLALKKYRGQYVLAAVAGWRSPQGRRAPQIDVVASFRQLGSGGRSGIW